MNSKFRLKLSIVMIVFALVISFTNAIIDHIRLKEEVLKNNQFQVQQIEELITYSLQSLEKAYYFFDEDTASRMKADTDYLVNLYEENSNFDEWNFTKLKDLLDADIYIINDKNVITHSSFTEDIGLDFSACCSKLAKILDERRSSGDFFADGMDMEQKTGEIKKYSYMATPDKKYLIELGVSLQTGAIFKEFNFLNVIEELEQKYETINKINVLNLGGFTLGESVENANLTAERRKAFEEALATHQTVELRREWESEPAVYRYVPYVSEVDKSSTENKVIEIIYNESELQAVLSENRTAFVIQLLTALGATIVISLIISMWVSRPMYLAFHDSLTGLKNRAAFDDSLKVKLDENKGLLALMVMDLDNFKLVNDYYGHDAGDRLLMQVAQKLQTIAREEDITVRLGGDEFVIIVPNSSRDEVKEMAARIIKGVTEATGHFKDIKAEITASIGIAIAPEQGIDPETLYKKADIALYTSKEKGKNQYHIYTRD